MLLETKQTVKLVEFVAISMATSFFVIFILLSDLELVVGNTVTWLTQQIKILMVKKPPETFIENFF